jgi:hypothetical protein
VTQASCFSIQLHLFQPFRLSAVSVKRKSFLFFTLFKVRLVYVSFRPQATHHFNQHLVTKRKTEIMLTEKFQVLTLSNPIFLPPAYSPARIYFGRERGCWITCNYPTVLKEKNTNRNRKSTACTVCWIKSVLHEKKRREQENHNVGRFSCSRCFSSCSMYFSQQIVQAVLFLFMFMFFSFKTVGSSNPPTCSPPKINKSWGVCGWHKNWIGKCFMYDKDQLDATKCWFIDSTCFEH